MTALRALVRKELLCLWATPLAWALLTAFLAVQGIALYLVLDFATGFAPAGVDEGPLQAYFSSLFVPLAMLLVCPALTMASFAEERRSGTLDTLLAMPVRAATIVLAKFLAAWLTYLALWVPTLGYVVMVRQLSPLEPAVVVASYAGVLLAGSAQLAVGLLMSAWVRAQLVAFMLTVGVLFCSFVGGVSEQVLDPGPLRSLAEYISLQAQLTSFSRGLVDSRHVVFDVSLCVLALFLAARRLRATAWQL